MSGAAAGSRASSGSSASEPAQRRSASGSGPPGSVPPHGGPARRGPRSFGFRRTGSSRATVCTVETAWLRTLSVLVFIELRQPAEFARALDASDGVCARNFDRASLNGYGIVTPTQVGSSEAFYPDFLWWVDGACWAIDTTGAHILEGKVRGKLLSIDQPRIALVAIGRISRDWHRSETKDGWILVRASGAIEPKPVHFDDLPSLLGDLRDQT